VWHGLGADLLAGLGGIRAEPIILPTGESTKSWGQLAELVDRLLEAGVERADHVVAFGGGVIGDLVGFATAILKRGCNYVQIPTSLLAQDDSSVGGKTGINTPKGKNLVGAFHQPSLVLIDPQCPVGMPSRHLRSGYAEVVKCALIGDAAFFAWCEAHGQGLIQSDPEALEYAVATSVAFKAEMVAADERETSGRRALLNLGHTFGHALEAETGFAGFLHGEAVALGALLAFRFSAERGLCSEADVARVTAHYEAVGLPTQLAVGSGASLTAHMAHDKKASGGRIPFILARGIGQAFVANDVALDEVAEFLDRQRQTATAEA
jgi:3-dehydroquinate synthase